MSDWSQSTYGAVTTYRRERARSHPEIRRLLSVTTSNGVIDQAKSGRRDISSDQKHSYLVVRKNDVVYNTMRMWQGVSGRADLEGIVSPAYTVVRPDPRVLDSRFLAHLMRLPANIALYRAFSQGLVSDTWNLKYSTLSRIPISLPSPEEQRRIAEILDAIDDSIRSTERLAEKLRLTRHGLLDNVLGSIDSGERIPLGNLTEIAGGIALSESRSVRDAVELPYLRVANVQDGFIDTSVIRTVKVFRGDVDRYRLHVGDVLMNEGGDFDKLGRGAVWDGQIDPCLHQNHVFRVRCDKNRLLPKFLTLFCQSGEGKAYLINNSKQTTNLASINKTQIELLPTPIPDLAHQQSAIDIMAAIDDRIHRETSAAQKRKSIRAGLAADLLSGRVRTG